ANGTIRMKAGSDSITGQLALDAKDVRVGGSTAATLHGQALAEGPLAHPQIDAKVDASDVQAIGAAARAVSATAKIAVGGGGVTISDARARAEREGRVVALTTDRIGLGGGRIAVENAVVTGLGQPIRVDLSKTARELEASADAPAIDLARVATWLGR